jgi:murein tripeptide amidase MpaA
MDSLLAEKKYANFISIKKLCETVGKNAINLITISTGKQVIKESKIIWILARQHPVETTSSFMVEGIITYLLQLMIKAVETQNSFYDNYIFKIVPMVNPDGVIHGNTRAELTGIDPNRVWKKPSKNTTPAIYHIKKQIQKTR